VIAESKTPVLVLDIESARHEVESVAAFYLDASGFEAKFCLDD